MTQKQKAGGALAAIVAGFGLLNAGRHSAPPPANDLDRALQQNMQVQQQRTAPPPAPVQTAPVASQEPAPEPIQAAPAQEQGTKVWVNTNSGIYHYPGARWYGNTREGEYMTEQQAIDHGYRASRRG